MNQSGSGWTIQVFFIAGIRIRILWQGWKKPRVFQKKPNPRGFFGCYVFFLGFWAFWALNKGITGIKVFNT